MIVSADWLMWLSHQVSEVTYRAAPMFTLHQINAFEDSGFLVMDMCCGDDGQVIGEYTVENLHSDRGEEMDKVNAYSFTDRQTHTHTHNQICLTQ